MPTDAPTKILVVDDDVDVARALEAYGRSRGYDVSVAHDGRRAVELAEQEQPDVILLDIALPGMDGRDVMVRLGELGVTKKAVVIFVTARDAQVDRIAGLQLGAADYETKPLHLNLLFQKIKRLVEKRRKGRI